MFRDIIKAVIINVVLLAVVFIFLVLSLYLLSKNMFIICSHKH